MLVKIKGFREATAKVGFPLFQPFLPLFYVVSENVSFLEEANKTLRHDFAHERVVGSAIGKVTLTSGVRKGSTHTHTHRY